VYPKFDTVQLAGFWIRQRLQQDAWITLNMMAWFNFGFTHAIAARDHYRRILQAEKMH
jgi:hypothetical protein